MTEQRSSISQAIRQNIQQLELFTDLSSEEIDSVVKHSKIKSLDEDEVLFDQGDAGDFLAIIIEGRIEITKVTDKDTPVALASLSKGATLGEMALVTQEPRSASAIASEPSTVFVLTRLSFDTLVTQSPQCGIKLIRKIAQILSNHIRQTTNVFAESIEPSLLS